MEKLAPLVEAFLASAEELKAKIEEVERVIDRQGLAALKPGTVVDKEFCDIEHDELKNHVCGRAKSLENRVGRRIWATWLALAMLLGWFGIELRAHSAILADLIKEVY